MKRFSAVFFSFISIVLVLMGCSFSQKEYDSGTHIFKRGEIVQNDAGIDRKYVIVTEKSSGKELELLFSDNTIKNGEDIYTYSYSGTDRYNYNVSITYPNGRKFWYSLDGGLGKGGDNVYDYLLKGEPVPSIDSYLDMDFLITAIQYEANVKEHADSDSNLIVIIIIAVVILIVICTAIFQPEKLPELFEALSEIDID